MTVTREVEVTNPTGLHARPAAELVKSAQALDAKLLLQAGDKSADAASIMSVLALGAKPGTVVQLTAEGPDSDAAIEAAIEILTGDE